MDPHADPHLASNGVSRALGHRGQDLMNDFTLIKTAGGCLSSPLGSR